MTLIIQKPTGAKLVLAQGQPVPNDPNFAFNSLLLHGNGTNGSTVITDSSGSPKTVTAVGNAQISTAQSKFGGASIAFDGTGDYATVPVSTDFEFGTGDFTVEGWINVSSFASSNSEVNFASLARGANGGGGPFGLVTCGWLVRIRSTQFSFYRFDGSTETELVQSFTFSTGVWYHIAVSRIGSSLRLFVDGSQQGAAFANSISYNRIGSGGSQDLHIGRVLFGGDTFFLNGYIDDLRITKGVSRYTANFTPPTLPFPDF
jgi:hypothetical protein